MIPTSIDGTDITGATIDGTDVQEITVDGDVVFSAQTIIEGFEDGNLSEYTGSSQFTVTGNNPISGNQSLRVPGTISPAAAIFSNTGLANYPVAGDKFSVLIENVGNRNIFAGIIFGNQSNNSDNYYWGISQPPVGGAFSDMEFLKDTSNGNLGTRTRFQGALSFGSFPYRLEVDWGTNGVIQCQVFEDSTNTLLGDESVTDTDYNSGGIGFLGLRPSGGNTAATEFLWDDFLIF